MSSKDDLNDIVISPSEGPLPWELLLLADPSKEMIKKYIDQSEVFTSKVHGKEVGVLALKVHEDGAEIMNVAVSEDFQGKGVGTQLINHAIHVSKAMDLSRINIGTADSSENQLALYKKLGFVEVGRLQNFFIEHYTNPIIENGKRAKDMIRLEINLS